MLINITVLSDVTDISEMSAAPKTTFLTTSTIRPYNLSFLCFLPHCQFLRSYSVGSRRVWTIGGIQP